MTTEEELIKACRQHDMKAQEALYKHFYSLGMSVALRYTSSREDALEVLNDAFMKVFRNIDQFDPNRPFKAWFRRIVVNTALDQYRSARKYHEHTILETDVPESPVLPDHDISLEAEEILKLLYELPDVQRHVFNLFEMEGYSHEEIASILDIATGTSRSHLTRARRKLELLYYKSLKNAGDETI